MSQVPAPLSKSALLMAFAALDEALPESVTLIVGGGGAMLLAHGLPVATADVDAYPAAGGMSIEQLDPLVKKVADAQGLPRDWLNPYYQTFSYVLPQDYGARLVDVFAGQRLRVRSLGVEDILIMKCFAGRAKDKAHARALLRLSPDLEIVNRRLNEAMEMRLPRALDAADFFDDLMGGGE
jgi:hypothetical protein